MSATTARVFVALWPGDAVRAQLAAWRDAWTFPRGATPVSSARLHVTLHFIGDVPRDRLPGLAAQLDVPFSPFDLTLDQASLWPHGVAVLEPLARPDGLTELQRALAARLDALGLPLDPRPYKPHVTMARRAERATPPPAFVPVQWRVEGYRLMESTMGPAGGYTTLACGA